MMASSVHTAHSHLHFSFTSSSYHVFSFETWTTPHHTHLHVLPNMDTLKQTISPSAIVLPFSLRLAACSMVLPATSKERQRSQVATGTEYECVWQCGNMGNQSTKDSSIYLMNLSSSSIVVHLNILQQCLEAVCMKGAYIVCFVFMCLDTFLINNSHVGNLYSLDYRALKIYRFNMCHRRCRSLLVYSAQRTRQDMKDKSCINTS